MYYATKRKHKNKSKNKKGKKKKEKKGGEHRKIRRSSSACAPFKIGSLCFVRSVAHAKRRITKRRNEKHAKNETLQTVFSFRRLDQKNYRLESGCYQSAGGKKEGEKLKFFVLDITLC